MQAAETSLNELKALPSTSEAQTTAGVLKSQSLFTMSRY